MASFDPWLNEYSGASQTMDELQIELNELRKLRKQNANTSKVTPNIRKLFQVVTNEINSLSEILEKNSKSGVITEREHTRRADMLNSLRQRKENLSNQYKQITTSGSLGKDPEREHLLGDSDSSTSVSKGRVFGKPQETEITRGLDNQGLVTYQREVMDEQDQTLNHLKDSVLRQKEVAIAISNELDVHNELLGELNNATDHTDLKLKKETKRLTDVSNKAKMGGALCLIVMLILAAVLLFIFL